ncbi:MAG TPA: sigma-70 family RNA polymerase sigma factor [Anaerolineaceae bacterium]
MNESQAIALLKKGDLRGLEMLVQVYYFPAVRACYLILQDRDQAEDIVQSAFLRAGEKIDQLASDRFGPWFYRMVINDSIKVAGRQRRFVALEADDPDFSLENWLIDPRPTPEDVLETREFQRTVWRALGRLTPEQRAAVVMKYYLQMSETEITQAQRVPKSTVKWRLYAAREKLRALLLPHAGRRSQDQMAELPALEETHED